MGDKDERIEGWDFTYLGEGYYELNRVPDSSGEQEIAMTGSDVNTDFRVPFPFRLIFVAIRHLDSSHAETTDALEIKVQKLENATSNQRFAMIYWRKTDVTVAKYLVKFPSDFTFSACKMTLTIKTDTGDLVVPQILLKRLGP